MLDRKHGFTGVTNYGSRRKKTRHTIYAHSAGDEELPY